MPFRVGLPELLVVLGIAVLVFGGKKIPELGKSLGEGIRGFKKALQDGETGTSAPPEIPATQKVEEKK